MRQSYTAIFATCVSLAVTASPATAHEPPRLVEYLSDSEWSADGLSTYQAATLESIRSDPAAIDVRIGQAYPDAVRSARALSLVVSASHGVGTASTVSFHDLEIELRSEQDYSLYARDEASGSEVSLVVLGIDVLGTIRHDAGVYKVHPLGGGLTAVYRYDSSALEESSGGAAEAVEAQGRDFASSMDSDPPPRPPVASVNTMPVIDILVVYTRRARAEAGNVAALIRHAIDQTNRIYANSRIRARVRLAYSYQSEYVEADGADFSTDWSRLRSTDDHYMDEVHAVRDQHGADLVVLLRGHHRNRCYNGHLYNDDSTVFSVIGQNCIGNYSLTQVLAINQGTSADLGSRPNRRFSYGHAFCNDLGNWRTLMSRNPNRRCPVLQPYFSNPDVSFMGSPTGDAHTRNNARVINETAPLIANYRQAPQSPHSVPLVTSADNESREGFVRVINRSNRAGTVRIHAIDDEGRRFEPIELSLDRKQTRHFNSGDLEDGNPDKEGLSGGVGDGTDNWRLELETELDIEVLAYIRTPDGFLTSIHDAAAQTDDGSMRHHVSIFNPGKNTDQQSLLRLINLGDDAADIEISGLDDQGDDPPGGVVRLTLPAGAAHLLTAEELEQGSEEFSGRFDVGSGKWQLFISANQPIQVMSLLLSPTGNLTNLSP